MPDPRPRPWELKVHTVHGGYQPMWEKWVWDTVFEHWEPVYEHVAGCRNTRYATREMCEAAVAGLIESGVAPPDL